MALTAHDMWNHYIAEAHPDTAVGSIRLRECNQTDICTPVLMSVFSQPDFQSAIVIWNEKDSMYAKVRHSWQVGKGVMERFNVPLRCGIPVLLILAVYPLSGGDPIPVWALRHRPRYWRLANINGELRWNILARELRTHPVYQRNRGYLPGDITRVGLPPWEDADSVGEWDRSDLKQVGYYVDS